MSSMWGDFAQYEMVYWPWQIAIYLFLAGLSAGSIMVALLVKWNKHESNIGTIWDSMVKAGAIISPLAICAGLGLLVLDLGRPLSFYWLLIAYNFSSVMSIGVVILLIYTPMAILFAMMIFEKSIISMPLLSLLRPVVRLIRSFASLSKLVEYALFILAVGVAVYTGFLLGAISKIALWNTPILPILFLVSGFSGGVAANILAGMLFFKGSLNVGSIKYLLALDFRAIVLEMPILAVLFAWMFLSGNGVSAKSALFGDFSALFWLGVVLLGLVGPAIIALSALKNHAYKPLFVMINCLMVLAGVVVLRYYIIYAGQAI